MRNPQKIARLAVQTAVGGFFSFLLIISPIQAGKGATNVPVMEDSDKGPVLALPEVLDSFLQAEFPGCRVPALSEFDPEMVQYYNSRLVGIHPAVAWGDFNGDKKTDFAFILVTGQSSWGPLVELVVLNGESRKDFTSYRLGEIYNFKDDYVCFTDGKLTKGRFKKSAWYINWNKKTKTYDVYKS